ncbi:MAG: hypothetical protein GX774_11970 [Armatimonadetes bacterium]|jgi:hypothetical protein|nr:hypothetical protein [Armatimonadota bacterium]
MANAYEDAMEQALGDANALVRHLEGLSGRAHATRAAIDHARRLAEAIEQAVYTAVRSFPQSGANAAAYQALEGVSSLRAAADGNDLALMEAAAHQIQDHLSRARDLAAAD